MDFNVAKSIFESLYSGVNGYTISQQARKKQTYSNKAHTYGEVTPEGFYKILNDINVSKSGVFYDLGSGTGKAVVLSALFGEFSKIIGIEILEDLVKSAENILKKFDEQVRPILKKERQNQLIEFVNADFLQADFSDADFVFTHSTCFYDELMAALERKFSLLKKGVKILTVTKTLQLPMFKLLKSEEYPMTWGKATVNFYEKT